MDVAGAALPIAILTFVVLIGLSITIFILMKDYKKKNDAAMNDLIQQVNSTQTYLYHMIKDNTENIESMKTAYSCVKCPSTGSCKK